MEYKALHLLSYGVYLVASEYMGKKSGYIANTVFQVTSDPVRLAISCNKNNYTSDLIQQSGTFSVSVLKKNPDMKLVGDFGFRSSSEINKFESANFFTAQSGAPIVSDSSLAWFDCKVEQLVDVGTHFLVVGLVLDCDILVPGRPLTYSRYREKFKMFSPVNAPTYVDPEKINGVEDEESAVSGADGEHICIICGYKYCDSEGDPSIGISAGTAFANLPDDYRCPICNAGKDYFREA